MILMVLTLRSRTRYIIYIEGDSLSDKDFTIISKTISKRAKSEGVRDFDQADFILYRLRDEYKVRIDDWSMACRQ